MTTSPVFNGWQPRAYFWEGGWIGIGQGGGVVPPHAHHAVQISLGLDGPLRLRDGDGEWQTHRGGIVLPDVTHSFDAAGTVVVMLFVDPESREGRWLRKSLAGPITGLPAERFECCLPGLRVFWDRPLDAMETARLVTSVVRNLCVGPPPVRTLDERVVRVLEAIRRSDASRIPLDDVARTVFLSPSRFAHLFAEEVGLPFRRYVLWRKLSRALQGIARGSSLSAAAHASGFSDSAHLTRTFYQMFGMAPTAMLGRGELYEIPAPFELAASGPPTEA
ncbi:MAG TPA: AraC family transcriptional regulator [Longimicrobiales bacterium]|nr:AraC family transcriptional regulator [Longimicrobiales bacterium]